VTFFEGEVLFDMSNEDIDFHVLVKGEIFAVLHQLQKETSFGVVFQDGHLLVNRNAGVANNPDASAALRPTLASGKLRVVRQQGRRSRLEGTPDWVLEVVSPGSVTKDTKTLRTAYHAAGIPEYWLVDARQDELSFLILHWEESGYVPAPHEAGWQVSSVFGRAFRLSRTVDEQGIYQYSLELRRTS
jgi:hypothetical protein